MVYEYAQAVRVQVEMHWKRCNETCRLMLDRNEDGLVTGYVERTVEVGGRLRKEMASCFVKVTPEQEASYIHDVRRWM